MLVLLTHSEDTEEQSSFAVILCCTDPSVFTSSHSDDSFTLFTDGDSISVDSMLVSIESVVFFFAYLIKQKTNILKGFYFIIKGKQQ